jgi:hypothetical protein
LAIQFKDTFANHVLVHTNLGWQHWRRQWFIGLELCWIYIRNGWYYRWMFETCWILYFEQPSWRSCGLLLTPWIHSSHLFIIFMHDHLHYIFQRFLGMEILLSFHLSLVHNEGGSFGRNVSCISSFSCFPSYCGNPPYLCFSFIGIWYTHSWPCFGCVVFWWLQEEFDTLRFLMQLTKCVAWSP